MRQMREDEVTYMLFDSMRKWSATMRRYVARSLPGDEVLRISAGVVADMFYRVEIYDAGTLVTREAFITMIVEQILGWRPLLRQDFTSTMQNVRDDARRTAALELAEAFAHLDMLRDSPEPPLFRSFTGGGTGAPQLVEG